MATKTQLIGTCPLHGDFYLDGPNSPCPSCEDGEPVELKPRKRKIKCLIGSVSHGTMREEDLIPVFIDTIAHFSKRKAKELGKEWASLEQEMIDAKDDTDCFGTLSVFLSETLFNTLDGFAGPFFYFGSHPGDGSDYGFWLSETWDQDLIDDGGIKVSDLSEVPRAFSGYVAQVSDHGNVTLYRYVNGRSYLEWAIV